MLMAGCTANSQVVAGKRVERIAEYYAACWGCPFHEGVASISWVYTDAMGQKVKHGPFQTFYGNGRLNYEANFLDGKQDGTATVWRENGEIEGQTFWRHGDETGWANYEQGKLVYSNESVYANGLKVGTRKFENDVWVLRFDCGKVISLTVDEKTGEMTPLQPPLKVACQ